MYALDESYKQTHLRRVDVESGKTSRVTSGDFSITAFNIARDGRRIAAQRGPSPLFGDSENGEVYVMDIDGTNAVRITTNGVDEFFPTISPKGDLVLFTTGANERFEPYYANRAFVAPVGAGAARVLAPTFPHAIDRAQWLKGGQEVLLSVNLGVRRELFVLDVATGRTRQVTDGPHALLAGGLVPELGRIALVVDEPMNPGEIWIASLEAPSTFRQVSRLSERYKRDFKLSRQERIEWKGADGVTVEGLLHYPVDHVAGKRYPSANDMYRTVTGNYATAGEGGCDSPDILFTLLNTNGDILSRKLFNSFGDEAEYPSSIVETSDNGFLITGTTTYESVPFFGKENIYVIKTDLIGNAPVSIKNINNEIPLTLLYQNYPHPFNPNTKIKFDLVKSGIVKIEIYDNCGKRISSLINEIKTIGTYEIDFDGSNLSSGVYYYKFITQNYS